MTSSSECWGGWLWECEEGGGRVVGMVGRVVWEGACGRWGGCSGRLGGWLWEGVCGRVGSLGRL